MRASGIFVKIFKETEATLNYPAWQLYLKFWDFKVSDNVKNLNLVIQLFNFSNHKTFFLQIYIEQAISEIAIAHARANSATISKMLHKRLKWYMRKERKVFIFSHPAKNQNCKSYSRIANPTGWLLTNLQMQMTFKIIGNLICKKSKIYCLIKLNVFNGFQNHGHIMLIVVITLFVICHTLKYLLQFLISLPYLVIPAAFEINLPRFVMKKLLLYMIKVHLP